MSRNDNGTCDTQQEAESKKEDAQTLRKTIQELQEKLKKLEENAALPEREQQRNAAEVATSAIKSIDDKVGNKHKTKFKKRGGTTNRGSEFEDCIMIHLILQMMKDPAITNFDVARNDSEFDSFDDVVIRFEKNGKSEQGFAIQLKFSKNDKSLPLNSLTGDEGNFSIKKYYQSFQKLQNYASNYKFILMTNRNLSETTRQFEIKVKEETQEETLKVELVKSNKGKFLETGKVICYELKIVEDKKMLFSSEISRRYETFFQHFLLCTNQFNVDETNKIITTQMTELFPKKLDNFDVALKNLFEFIKRWDNEENWKSRLNKPLMQEVITLCLLEEFICPIISASNNENKTSLRNVMSEFILTVFRKESLDVVQQLWGNNDKAIDKQTVKEITQTYYLERDLNAKKKETFFAKLLWLTNKCPLVVKENPYMEKIIQVCPHKKFVLIEEGKTFQMDVKGVFRQLSDLTNSNDSNKLKDSFKCTLTGKEVNLKELLTLHKDFEKIITTDILLKMIEQPYALRQKEESLMAYIPRSVYRNCIKKSFLDSVDSNTLVFIDNLCEDTLDTSRFNVHRVEDIGNIGEHQQLRPTLFVSKTKCSQNEFYKVCKMFLAIQNFHYFRMSQDELEWYETKGNMSELKNYSCKSGILDEESLLKTPPNKKNIIAGEPGMGKTVLLRSLKNQIIPNCFAVMMSAKDISLYCSTYYNEENWKNSLENFVATKVEVSNGFDEYLFKLIMERDEVVYLWDGLDELSEEHLKIITKVINELASKVACQWITCRDFLAKSLENNFNVFSTSIVQFKEEEQRQYIKKRLKSPADDTIFEIMDQIKRNMSYTGNDDVFGIPIYLFMLTELFLQKGKKDTDQLKKLNNIAVLYEHFVEEKLKVFEKKGEIVSLNKFQNKMVQEKKESRMPNYRKVSMRLLFSEYYNCDKFKCDEFIEEIKSHGDEYGFISKITEDNQPQFSHYSFAEYFAASYLAEHKKEIPDFVFKPENTNVRFLLDMLLAKNSPAHIAVLAQNFNVLQKSQDEIHIKDARNRHLLPVACSWGQRFPALQVEKVNKLHVVDDRSSCQPEIENKYQEMLKFLLTRFEVDEEVKRDCFSFAMKSRCLSAIATLDETWTHDYLKNQDEDFLCNILYYSVKYQWTQTIERIKIHKDTIKINQTKWLHFACQSNNVELTELLLFFGADVNTTDEDGVSVLYSASVNGNENIFLSILKHQPELTDIDGDSLLHKAVRNGNQQAIICLTKFQIGINATDKHQWTPLHLAARYGEPEIVKLLIDGGSHVNACDEDNSTPLHFSAQHGHDEASGILLERGANINAFNKFGWTPIYSACYNDQLSSSVFLQQHGANIEEKLNGRTLIDVAVENEDYEVAKAFKKLHAKTSGVEKDYEHDSQKEQLVEKTDEDLGPKLSSVQNDDDLWYKIANTVLQLATDTTVPQFSMSSLKDGWDLPPYILNVDCTSKDPEKIAILFEGSKERTNILEMDKYVDSLKKLKMTSNDKLIVMVKNGCFTKNKVRIKTGGTHFKAIFVKCSTPIKIKEYEMTGTYYKLEIKDSNSFDNIIFCNYEEHVDQVEKEILTTMKKRFACNNLASIKYAKVIKKCCQDKDNKLDKRLVQQIITLCVLTPYIQTISSGSANENVNLLQNAISKFDVTIFDKDRLEDVKQIYSDVKEKFLNGSNFKDLQKRFQIILDDNKNLTDKDCAKLMWVSGDCPLIVDEKPELFKIIDTFKTGRFILSANDPHPTLLENCSVFRNISSLSGLKLYQQIIKNYKCLTSIEINLKDLFEQDSNFKDIVTTNELIQMLHKPYRLQQLPEKVPEVYINRTVSINVIDYKFLQTVDKESVAIISNVTNKDIEKYVSQRYNKTLKEPVEKSNIYAVKTCTEDEFDEICKKNRSIKKKFHHFGMVDRKLKWLKSSGGVSDLEPYRLNGDSVKEGSLFNSGNNINIISDKPGKGKTVLLKKLSQVSGSFAVYLSKIDILALCQKINLTIDDFIIHITNKYSGAGKFDQHLIGFLARSGQITCFWDGLDEIHETDLQILTNFIKIFSENKSKHYISCRLDSAQLFEDLFSVLSITIDEFNDEQINSYIQNRHAEKNAATQITKHFNFIKQCNIFGHALPLFMLTELVLLDSQKYLDMLNNDVLVTLTDLFDSWLHEKLKLSFKNLKASKQGNNFSTLNGFKNHKIDIYQKTALMAIFEPSFWQNFIFPNKYKEMHLLDDELVSFFKASNGELHFLRNVFTDYLVATFLFKHHETSFDKSILFNVKYTPVRFLFDELLAKASSPLIAVLYKQFDQVLGVKTKDLANRNVLQFVSSWGERYPVLNVRESGDYCTIEDKNDFRTKPEDLSYLNFLNQLLDEFNITESDNVFGMDAIKFAESSESLLTYLSIALKNETVDFHSKSVNFIYSCFYYTRRFGFSQFDSLFKDVKSLKTSSGSILEIDQAELLSVPKTSEPIKVVINRGEDEEVNAKMLNAALTGEEKVVELMLQSGANVNAVDQNDWTALMKASLNGHEEVVKLLLDSGGDAKAVDKDEWTALMKASQNGYEKVVKLLLDSGGDAEAVDRDGWTALMKASKNGHEKVVETLLQSDGNINAKNNDDWTALMIASHNGHEKVVELLLAANNDVNAVNKDGSTAIMIASQKGQDKVVELLIKSGADLNAVDQNSWTAMMKASLNGHEKVVKLLLDSGGDAKAVDKDGWTAIMKASKNGYDKVVGLLVKAGEDAVVEYWSALIIAIQHDHENVIESMVKSGLNINAAMMQASKLGNEKAVKLLVKLGADPNAVDTDNNCSAMIIASQNGHETVVEQLIESGGDINAVDKDNWTSMMKASQNGHEKVVELLLAKGGDAKAVDKDGWTALMKASKNGYEIVVKMLLQPSGNVNVENNDGWTALMIAAKNGHERVVRILRDSGGNIKGAMIKASKCGDEKTVDLLIKSGCNSNTADEDKTTAMMHASENGHEKVVELLIKKHGDTNALNEKSCTAMMFASLKGHENVVKLLLEKGAKVNVKDNNNWTAMMKASLNGHEGVVKLLLEAGEKVNAVDKDGWTAMMKAAKNGYDKVVELLIRSRGNVNAQNKKGQTAMTIASEFHKKSVVDLLAKYGGKLKGRG